MCDRTPEKRNVFVFFIGHTSQNNLQNTFPGASRVTGHKLADPPRVTAENFADPKNYWSRSDKY